MKIAVGTQSVNIENIKIGESFIVVNKNTHIIGDTYKYSSKGMNPHIESLMKDNYIETIKVGTAQFFYGADRRFFNEVGIKYDNKTLLQKGLITIEDGKKIDEFDNIVDMSELELFKKNPSDYPLKKIDTSLGASEGTVDENGIEYLAFKTDKELFNDKIISIEEYNSRMDELRQNAYTETDKMNNRLLNDKGLSDDEKTELEESIATRKAEIKKENPKRHEL